MKKPKPGVLIIGGNFSCLGMARNLVKHKIDVYIADEDINISEFSRIITKCFRSPKLADEPKFLEYLKWMALEKGLCHSVIFPSTDEAVRILAQNRDFLLQYYDVVTPSWDTVKFLYDKRLSCSLAAQQGVPAPWTYTVQCEDEINRLPLEFPTVVKPAITSHYFPVTHKKAYLAKNLQEVYSTYQILAEIIAPSEILIQEYIPGSAENLYSFFGYFKEGKPLVGSAAKRTRQHPMDFGILSTFVETVQIPELEILAARLLSGIHYTGLAEIEFMYDTKHNRFEFLEVNPRIWGWFNLAVFAGLDLPFIAYSDALGDEYEIQSCREGVKWVHLKTDLFIGIQEVWQSHLSLKKFLQSLLGSREAVFAPDDPLPFIMDWLLVPFFFLRRSFHKR